MIVKISKIQSFSTFSSKINYNELKLEKQKAKLYFDNTLSTNAQDRLCAFKTLIDLNKNIRNNYGYEFIISFSEKENLKNIQFDKLLGTYFQKIGFQDTAKIIYSHHDTKNFHFHAYVSSVDWNSKKVNEKFLHLRSQSLSREIEKQFKLNITEYNSSFNNNNLLNANHRRFYLQISLQKALKAYNTKDK